MNLGGSLTLGVLTALFAFGIGYNTLVDWMERNGHDRGYTAFLVVGGCLATILGAFFLVGLEDTILIFLCFAASGLPMTVGSMSRHARRERDNERKAEGIARDILNGDEGGEDDH